jgi:hypothetical protein
MTLFPTRELFGREPTGLKLTEFFQRKLKGITLILR